MSDEFKDRLLDRRLTNVDQYRQMQAALSDTAKESSQPAGDTEEWKTWQLAPVVAGGETEQDSNLLDPLSESAQGLYQAIKVLDQK